MEESIEAGDLKEGLERLEGATGEWRRGVALTTALIAVLAAVASLVSGNLANRALLAKNEALLLQIKASDTWNEYQSKSIKIHLLESGLKSSEADAAASLERYRREQARLKENAETLESRAEDANRGAERFLEKHHTAALSVTIFQIAIALSAISALLGQRSFWMLSVAMGLVGTGLFAVVLF